jgi:hypothetical protein
MTNPRTFVLSNLANGVFIELNVDAEEDVLLAARAHLQQTELPQDVQQGFFLSVYPTNPSGEYPLDAHPATEGPDLATSSTRQAPEDPAHPDALSPLDAAAAQGPMDWSESNSPANAAPGPDTADVSLRSPIVAPPLGSAGGH